MVARRQEDRPISDEDVVVGGGGGADSRVEVANGRNSTAHLLINEVDNNQNNNAYGT